MSLMLLTFLVPILCGIALLCAKESFFPTRKRLILTAAVIMGASQLLLGVSLATQLHKTEILFYLTEQLPILFRPDETGVLFAAMAAVIFAAAFVFSFVYMKHEAHEKRYYGFYLIVFGVLIALCFAGNLVTFYFFFEMLTLTSMPLVLHNQSHEAVIAGLKYLLYSLCGAYAVLFGLYFVAQNSTTMTFTHGGVLTDAVISGNGNFFLGIAFGMILGFGVKAGMFPLHAWLTSAHPVAPAPASAVLSAVIVKAGVLGILRVVYDIFGTAFLRGTWVQEAWLVLTLITVFMGSMLAYREKVLKKRLAYSTVSQVSYILFGLALMNTTSVTGSLLHVLAHGFVKAVLFLCAGAIIFRTGKTRVDELRGIGKQMPVTMWCYTIAALGLIGIPPTGGFLSKWYLCMGALDTGMKVFAWLGPAVLLVSALLTAGYLLPISINGFFPGADYDYGALKKEREQNGKESAAMTVPILVLTVCSVWMGLFPTGLLNRLEELAAVLVK